ncbi:hypothetical protein HK100_001079 [Physocladia obscura]|uniref:glucan 1,3-beta-glucosidase n=1 Tax=Physocladia obscura TaxID=109957 RepID=A0AAD5SXB3_9FUNG|nr:hypothetical protein HK100_001079 [Physocladia obscura]
MHIIIGLHSLPGGVNNLDIGEALMHNSWFYNSTNLAYSYKAVDAILKFIVNTGHIDYFTLAPINEASDNLTNFGTPDGLSQNASNYVGSYFHGVLDRIKKVDSRIPLMVQDSFKGTEFWVPYFNATDNIVFDVHDYFFAVDGKYAEYVHFDVCGQAEWTAEETTFPIFVGEWALQVKYNNTLAGRQEIFDVQRHGWNKYLSGSAFWTAVSYANASVSGEGVQSDYWSYIKLIDAGVTNGFSSSFDYCANTSSVSSTTTTTSTYKTPVAVATTPGSSTKTPIYAVKTPATAITTAVFSRTTPNVPAKTPAAATPISAGTLANIVSATTVSAGSGAITLKASYISTTTSSNSASTATKTTTSTNIALSSSIPAAFISLAMIGTVITLLL